MGHPLEGDKDLLLGGDIAIGAVDGGGKERFVITANINSFPLCFSASIVNVGEPGATVERIISDARHAVGDGDAREPGATGERIISDACHAVGDGDACETGATVERQTFDARHAVGDGDARETGATVERQTSDARHAVGDGDACKTDAAIERTLSDARHAVGDGDAREPGAIGERKTSDARHAAIGRDYAVLTPSNHRFAFGFNNAITLAVIYGILSCNLNARQPGAT